MHSKLTSDLIFKANQESNPRQVLHRNFGDLTRQSDLFNANEFPGPFIPISWWRFSVNAETHKNYGGRSFPPSMRLTGRIYLKDIIDGTEGHSFNRTTDIYIHLYRIAQPLETEFFMIRNLINSSAEDVIHSTLHHYSISAICTIHLH